MHLNKTTLSLALCLHALCWLGGIFLPAAAHAEFIISSAIIEFAPGAPKQQEVELISRSQESDYVVSEIHEVIHPGSPQETRRLIEDPAEGGLLVTPDKTVIPAGGRRVMRFVLLRNADAQEHIYRVAIKPVIRGLHNDMQVGLKILVGYEALVIVRPAKITPSFTLRRQGRSLEVINHGNASIFLQSGTQCAAGKPSCAPLPALRVYAGNTEHAQLPADAPAGYTVWDGVKTAEYKAD